MNMSTELKALCQLLSFLQLCELGTWKTTVNRSMQKIIFRELFHTNNAVMLLLQHVLQLLAAISNLRIASISSA
jgi:hypothetical protein